MSWTDFFNSTKLQSSPSIVPREQLDFDLEGDIPNYWLDGDAFKTRFFDAMSTLFPVGERFFITCVRDFKGQIHDPHLLAEIDQFTRQEAQHNRFHRQYNARLQAQGIEVKQIMLEQEKRLYGIVRRICSRRFTLGMTAAAEHLTALMAILFVQHTSILETADRRMRAFYIWHAMEEMEHKGVAFDVLQRFDTSYFTRASSAFLMMVMFPYYTMRIMSYMFKTEGFGFKQRCQLWWRGLGWLYRMVRSYPPVIGLFLDYFKPGFHPWQHPIVPLYETWLEAMSQTGDAIASGDKTMAARSIPS